MSEDNSLFWVVYCEDIDCYSCDSGNNLTVSTPGTWESFKVIKYLTTNRYTCPENNDPDLAEEEEPWENPLNHVTVSAKWS